MIALGDDFHIFHVHGHRWLPQTAAARRGVVGPRELPVRWREDAPGTWLYHCHVESHMTNGMIGLYVVTK